MLTDPHVAIPKPAGHNSEPLTGIVILNPEKIVREYITETTVEFFYGGQRHWAAGQRTVIDHLLNLEMSLGFEL